MVHQRLLPSEIIEHARTHEHIALLGNCNLDRNAWLSILASLEKSGWNYFIIDPTNSGLNIEGQPIYATLEEINEDIGFVLLMDTTQKKQWMDIIAYRMEVRGDIELIWSHLGCEINKIDESDFHSYGWSYVHNESLVDYI